MSSSDLSGVTGTQERPGKSYRLEDQRKEAGDIVQRWFRFRARRGIGVFYSLISIFPVLGTILSAFSVSPVVIYSCITLAVFLMLFFAKSTGIQSFDKMTATIRLLKDDSAKDRSYSAAALFVVFALWPWLGYLISTLLHQPVFAILFALTWLVELVLYRLLGSHRKTNSIIDVRVEDWVIIIAFPLAAIISTIGILPHETWFSAFLLISPLVLLAGMKSLYEAPKELVSNLDE
jgi:hypothetical protein